MYVFPSRTAILSSIKAHHWTYLLDRRIGAVVGHGAQLKQRRVPGTECDDGRRSVVVHVVPMFHDRGGGIVAGSGSAVTVTVTVVVAEAVFDSVTGRSTIPARCTRVGGRLSWTLASGRSHVPFTWRGSRENPSAAIVSRSPPCH